MTADERQEPGSGLRRRIEAKTVTLRPAERRVADHLHAVAGRRLDQSITDLARDVGVSDATVSRLCRTLGFTGFADLKLSMAADQGRVAYPNIPADLQWSDSVVDIARKLSTVFAGSIADTEQTLRAADLEAAVHAIMVADKVIFMGVGGAAAICEEAAHIFLKIGIDARSYSDGYTQTIVASTMQPDCLLVAVSHTGMTPTVVAAVTAARQNRARTIAITGHHNSALAHAAELVFATAPRSEHPIPLHGDFLEGRISQLYLIDVLYLSVMFRLDEVARERLGQTTRALAEHYGVAAAPTQHPAAVKQRRARPSRPG